MPGGSKIAGSSVHSPRVRGPEAGAQCIVALGRSCGLGLRGGQGVRGC